MASLFGPNSSRKTTVAPRFSQRRRGIFATPMLQGRSRPATSIEVGIPIRCASVIFSVPWSRRSCSPPAFGQIRESLTSTARGSLSSPARAYDPCIYKMRGNQTIPRSPRDVALSPAFALGIPPPCEQYQVSVDSVLFDRCCRACSCLCESLVPNRM